MGFHMPVNTVITHIEFPILKPLVERRVGLVQYVRGKDVPVNVLCMLSPELLPLFRVETGLERFFVDVLLRLHFNSLWI